jgi:hypothetical protein
MQPEMKQSWDITAAKGVESFVQKTQKMPNFLKKPAGVLLVILGIILFILPGPGLLILICGLTLLSPKTAETVKSLSRRYAVWRIKRQQRKK